MIDKEITERVESTRRNTISQCIKKIESLK